MTKIYLSSTFTDLTDHREAVYRILRTMRHDVMAMEDYVATDQRPVDKCLRDVEAANVYLGIFAWRYGYVPDLNNPEGRSITELEFRHARARDKPCLLFLLDEDAPWPKSRMDRPPAIDRVDALRAEMRRDCMVTFFVSPDDLAKKVAASVAIQQAESDLLEAARVKGQGEGVTKAAAELRRAGPVRRGTAIWVDDNPDGNVHENIMLSSLGLEITQAMSTDTARIYMARKRFDLILTDMSRGDDPGAGLKFIKDVRDTDKLTPVVVYMFKADNRGKRALKLGATAAVTTPGDLLTAVLNALPAAPQG